MRNQQSILQNVYLTLQKFCNKAARPCRIPQTTLRDGMELCKDIQPSQGLQTVQGSTQPFLPCFFFFFNNSFSHSSTFPHAAFSYSVNLHTVPAGNRHGGVGIDWHSHVGMEIKTLLLGVDSVRSQQSFWGIRELTQHCMSCNHSASEQFLVH